MKLVARWLGLASLLGGCGASTAQVEGPWFELAANVYDGARDGKGGEAVAVFDADLDGWLDFVIVNGQDRFFVVLNQADATGKRVFSATRVPILPDSVPDDGQRHIAKGLGLHDFDDDGALDVYLATRGQGTLKLKPRSGSYDYAWTQSDIDASGLFYDSAYSVQMNHRDGTFTTRDLGLDGAGSKRHMVFDDFDGDGHIDGYLSVATYFGIWWGGGTAGNQIFPGTDRWDLFAPDVVDTTLDEPGFWKDAHGRSNKDFKAAVVRDFDGDGRADVAAGAYADIWNAVAYPPGVTAAAQGEIDLDGDGLGDGGYQGTWARGVLLLRNVSQPGSIRFEDATTSAFFDEEGQPQIVFGPTAPIHVHSVVPADIDNDGDLDLFVSGPRNFTTHSDPGVELDIVRLYRNDSVPGQMKFSEITLWAGIDFANSEAGLRSHPLTRDTYPIVLDLGDPLVFFPSLSAGCALDVDNDGDVDFVHIDRQLFDKNPLTQEPLGLTLWLWQNDGSGRLTLVAPETHGLVHTARDLSYGDLDNDGRVDLVTVNGSGGGQNVDDGNFVFLNRIHNQNHYVKIDVTRPGSRLGLGTKVTVCESKSGGCAGGGRRLGYDEVRTDFSYRSKRSTTLHFGVGRADGVDVKLEAPGGQTAVFTGLDVDRTHHLVLK